MPSDPLSVAVEVATRLRDAADDVDANCGIAMLFDELDRIQPGRGWALAAKDKLASAVRVIEQTGNRSPRLYNGIGTLGLAAWRLSRDGKRYQQVLAEVDRWVVDRASADGRALAERPCSGGRPRNGTSTTRRACATESPGC
ncbi:lanthionine synthetase LanC family protein [Kibdelosporangium aridum]|uniref:Lanthionine synthetase C-like protein n=1 Tax=Kibdelosporangium aridum TaxID=2030 RepID=A0A1W2FY97_KIBAR|nr:lanthionine synthetase LanC family protein [Kibdelosporangium aridum]SMD26833.1 Lanthionine synthetase C-like protein [Kibdelosporangium aridum]